MKKTYIRLIALVFAFVFLFSQFNLYTFAVGNKGSVKNASLSVSAHSAILIDASDCNVFFEKNADERLPMASTTKIMTALVAIENTDVTDEVVIPCEAVGVEGSSVYLYEGEILTLEELLYALLLESANDAAEAIALYVGGSIEGFAEMMNAQAQKLGLENTHFTNPHGLHDDEHYTTARDLAKITAYALGNDTFREIVSTYKKVIPNEKNGSVRLLINHNRLLRTYSGMIGVKTGFTKKSGRCLVTAAERDGLRLVAVTLNAPDDWRDHTAMLNYGFDNYVCESLCEDREFDASLHIVNSEKSEVKVTNSGAVSLTMPKNHSGIECTVEMRRFEYAPIREGDEVGRLLYFCDGKLIGESKLIAQEGAEQIKYRKSFFEWLASLFGR